MSCVNRPHCHGLPFFPQGWVEVENTAMERFPSIMDSETLFYYTQKNAYHQNRYWSASNGSTGAQTEIGQRWNSTLRMYVENRVKVISNTNYLEVTDLGLLCSWKFSDFINYWMVLF